MFSKTFFAIAAIAATAFAAVTPAPLEKRAETWLEDLMLQVCRERSCSQKVLLCLFETALVESGIENLNYGDQDSLGLLQQRPSMKVWGTAAQIMDPRHAITVFLNVAIPGEKAHPGYTSGQLAQFVQGSERPNAYTNVQGQAQSILDATIKRNGGGSSSGGAANVAAAPKPATTAAKPATTSTSSGKAVAAPKNLASGTIKTGCKQYYTVAKGNTCYALQTKFGITVSKFLSVNKGVHSSCNNLQIGQAYCVKV